MNVALTALKHPTHIPQLRPARNDVRAATDSGGQGAETGQPIASDNPRPDYLLRQSSTAELQKLPPSPAILQAILTRTDAADAVRSQALATLASDHKLSAAAMLLNIMDQQEQMKPGSSAGVAPIPESAESPRPQGSAPAPSATGHFQPNAHAAQCAWAVHRHRRSIVRRRMDRLSQISVGRSRHAQRTSLCLRFGSRGTAQARVLPLLSVDTTEPDDIRQGRDPRLPPACPTIRRNFFTAFVALIDKGIAVPDATGGIPACMPSLEQRRRRRRRQGDREVGPGDPERSGTDQDYVETVQFASELAGVLPPDQSSAVRKELKSLKVAVFVINTLARANALRHNPPGRGEQGKPFEIIFQNNDFMPHNLAVVKPGMRRRSEPSPGPDEAQETNWMRKAPPLHAQIQGYP